MLYINIKFKKKMQKNKKIPYYPLKAVFGHVFKFPGKFCHLQISQIVVYLYALELPQI